ELNSTTYASDADVNGIKWQPHFTEMDVVVNNPTDHDYGDLDIYIRIDALIAGGGISRGVNQCNMGPDSCRSVGGSAWGAPAGAVHPQRAAHRDRQFLLRPVQGDPLRT